MKTLTIILLIEWAAFLSASAQTGQNVNPLSAQAGEKWVIRWDRSDDFNKDAIDIQRQQARGKLRCGHKRAPNLNVGGLYKGLEPCRES